MRQDGDLDFWLCFPPIAIIKYPNKSRLREEGFTLVLWLTIRGAVCSGREGTAAGARKQLVTVKEQRAPSHTV